MQRWEGRGAASQWGEGAVEGTSPRASTPAAVASYVGSSFLFLFFLFHFDFWMQFSYKTFFQTSLVEICMQKFFIKIFPIILKLFYFKLFVIKFFPFLSPNYFS